MSTSDWLLVLTAIFTGLATLITAYAGLVKTKRDTRSDAEEECERKLKELRRENEEIADELHQQRMRKAR